MSAVLPRVDEIVEFLGLTRLCGSLDPAEIAEFIFALQVQSVEPTALVHGSAS